MRVRLVATREGEAMTDDSPGGCPLCHDSLLVRCDGAECPIAPHEVHMMPCTDPFGLHDRGQLALVAEVAYDRVLAPDEIERVEDHITRGIPR